MEKTNALLQATGNVIYQLSSDDLTNFSNLLLARAKNELAESLADEKRERYLTKNEVKELCGVCDATLWHWDKKKYLRKIKIGNKVKYKWSEVKNIIEGK